MFISDFRIDRFGFFSNVEVKNLSNRLTIFLGQNEAGKSTCLEFFRTMLTGWPKKRDEESILKIKPVNGGFAGGSIFLKDISPDSSSIRISRREDSTISILKENGSILSEEYLFDIFKGIDREVYSKIFGFSLTELETVGSLNSESIRNMLYGAIFGTGLKSPGLVLKKIRDQKEKIYKANGSNQKLIKSFQIMEDLQGKIFTLQEENASYTILCQELDAKSSQMENLRKKKRALEETIQQFEKQLTIWINWEQYLNISKQIENIERNHPVSGIFPNNADAKLEHLEENRLEQVNKINTLQQKINKLNEEAKNLKPDYNLLKEKNILRQLSERKNSYKNALNQISHEREKLQSEQASLSAMLNMLGTDWTIERILNTDRSLFHKEDLNNLAREMETANQTAQVSESELAKINQEIIKLQQEINETQEALSRIPQLESILNENERNLLIENMTRLEECRRNEPAREEAVKKNFSIFSRAINAVKIAPIDESLTLENISSRYESINLTLHNILNHQPEALELANETIQLKEEEANLNRSKANMEEQIEQIKIKLENIQENWRTSGSNKISLESKTKDLRSLRILLNKIDTEKERLQELDQRIHHQNSLPSQKNWTLLICSGFFFIVATAIFLACNFFNMSALHLTEKISLPLNLWASYLALLCGVIFLGAGLPRNRKEEKSYKIEMANLQNRRENSAMQLAELGAEAQKLCAQTGVDNLDLITLEAKEALLEFEKEQYFHDEQTGKEIEKLKEELNLASQKLQKIMGECRDKENQMQNARKRWHGLMQGLKVGVVPLPENADMFFAKIDSTLLAFNNLENSQKELNVLWEDLHILEESITSLPIIEETLKNSPEPLRLEQAVQKTLETCREDDLMQERRKNYIDTLEKFNNQLNSLQTNQKKAFERQTNCAKVLEAAKNAWHAKVQKLGLGYELSPETVREAFNLMGDCLEKAGVIQQTENFIKNLANEIESFEKPFASLLNKLNIPVSSNLSGDADWISNLNEIQNKYDEAEISNNNLIQLTEKIRHEENNLSELKSGLDNIDSKIHSMFKQAQVESIEEYLDQYNNFNTINKLRNDLASYENVLKIFAKDQPWEDLITQFKDTDQSTLERELAQAKDELEKINDKNIDLAREIGELKVKTQNLANSEELSFLRQKEAIQQEEINNLAKEWDELAISEGLILKAQKIFEKEQQPEIVKEASVIFNKITGGAWKAINISLDDHKLTMINADGEALIPEILSRGTKEQAYLALRLAYIQHHNKNNTSLPVIMDEILVNFDPGRAQRTATTLIDLAETGQQLLYFTCHPHVVEMFQTLVNKTPLSLKIYEVKNKTILVQN